MPTAARQIAIALNHEKHKVRERGPPSSDVIFKNQGTLLVGYPVPSASPQWLKAVTCFEKVIRIQSFLNADGFKKYSIPVGNVSRT